MIELVRDTFGGNKRIRMYQCNDYLVSGEPILNIRTFHGVKSFDTYVTGLTQKGSRLKRWFEDVIRENIEIDCLDIHEKHIRIDLRNASEETWQLLECLLVRAFWVTEIYEEADPSELRASGRPWKVTSFVLSEEGPRAQRFIPRIIDSGNR